MNHKKVVSLSHCVALRKAKCYNDIIDPTLDLFVPSILECVLEYFKNI